MIIAVDFDGTIVKHAYPEIGEEIKGAFLWMNKWKQAGARLILYTMRSQDDLKEAYAFCRERGVDFWALNENPTQGDWTVSPKVFADIYVDDSAFGCPKTIDKKGNVHVDWSVVGPAIHQALTINRNGKKENS